MQKIEDQAQKAIQKIKKCLALAASDNPHEAAAAMRQAKGLMEKYNISAADVSASDIYEYGTKSTTMARDKPSQWETGLAHAIGNAFGCKMLVNIQKLRSGRIVNCGEFIFIGVKHQAEIAAYTASVLIRKCKKARANYMQSLPKNYRKTHKTKAGDAFALGWAYEIRSKVTEFANPQSVQEAIEKKLNESVTSDKPADVRTSISKNPSYAEKVSAQEGRKAAQQEQLYRPMKGQQANAMIGFEIGSAA